MSSFHDGIHDSNRSPLVEPDAGLSYASPSPSHPHAHAHLDVAANLAERAQTQTTGGDALLGSLESVLQALSASSSLRAPQLQRLRHYSNKLSDARASVSALARRTQAVQRQLNRVRSAYKPHEKALVQRGPFHYRCVWGGGVRYREYPSADAAVKKLVSAESGGVHNVSLSVSVSASASICLSVYLSICLSVYLTPTNH